MENLGFRFSGNRHHLVYERGEVWKVCYFVPVRITIEGAAFCLQVSQVILLKFSLYYHNR